MDDAADDKTRDVTDADTDGTEQCLAADRIIRRNMWWSAGAGIVPVAYLDTIAISVVQMKMLKELADLYGVPFKASLGKAALATLIGSVMPTALGYGFVTSAMFQSFLRATPVVGPVIGVVAIGGFAAAATYAVGRVFDQHFASGGTFLTFDPQKVEAYFREQFAEAKRKGAAFAGGSAT